MCIPFFSFAEILGVRKTCLFFLLFLPGLLFGQTVALQGQVEDTDGQRLPLAHILILPDSTIVATALDGTFSTSLPQGTKNITISYTGYEVYRGTLKLEGDTSFTFRLSPKIGQLEEVTVTSNRYSQEYLVQSARVGTTVLTKKDITAVPVLGGEADIIKTLQLLPGTVRGVEGSSDLFVRGGAADQNLVLLDGAPIYNTSHLLGFLSVFNPDILDNVEAINGGFPAEYGGRLSSVVDISSKSSIARKTTVSGDVGLIASRLYVEQPLVKDKMSIWLAGRRTYIDKVFKLIDEDLPYFFYDINGKINYQPGARDKISISHYQGEDILDFSEQEDDEGSGFTSTYASGNSSQSIQWHHRYGNGWNSHLSLSRTAFEYNIRNTFQDNELFAFSDIEDYGAKLSFERDSLWFGARIKTGIEWTRHAVKPSIINSTGFFADLLESSTSTGKIAHEVAAHVQQEWLLTDKLLLSAGLRGTGALLQSTRYFTPEPRVSFRYTIRENQSLKVSYSRMAQYMHRISSSAISSPTDIWYPVTEKVRPQLSHQASAAWQQFLQEPQLFFSVEAYYKSMDRLIGYEEGTNLFFNSDFESQLVQGKGQAYGFEFLLRKEAGKLSGWLSYTLSWSRRQFDEINQGEWFRARYDRRHNGALVAQYKLGNRWAASMVWEYISGSRFTPVIGQYVVPASTLRGVDVVPLYSGINDVKLSDSHRLDLGLKFTSKPERALNWHLFAGVNNVYNRASPIGVFIEQDEADGSLRYIQPGLFGLLPFINIGFKF
jgi:hypothetical protein